VTRDDLTKASHEQLVDLVVSSQERLDEVERQLSWFKKQLFGAKSERRIIDDSDADQLSLGESLEVPADPPAPSTTVRTHQRHRRPPKDRPDESGLRFDDSVPVETIEIPNAELADVSEADQEFISEKVNYQLAQRPAAYVVVKFVRKTVKRKDTGELTTPPAPFSVLEKSYADVSLLAGMLIDKFRYHLPLYRQHQRMKACGITVSRGSLTNWVRQASELLEPIYEAQLASIVDSSVLAMDETPIRAGRKAKGKMRTAYFWPLYGEQDEVAFPYAPSRSKRHVEEILGAFAGTLITDGYDAYERYVERRDELTHALCWAHTRRGFVKSEDVEPARSGKALDLIGQLYAVESKLQKKGVVGAAKAESRSVHSKPIVDGLFVWLEQELIASALLPTNPFTKAARYALERQAGLRVFLEDPDVPVDTNHLERALRVIPMGRKNWLFCWTELGAHHVGQVQSLITTCVLHGVDPYTYLVDVLQRIAIHPQARVAELTPRLWKQHFAEAPLGSWIDS
jgi:transposase